MRGYRPERALLAVFATAALGCPGAAPRGQDQGAYLYDAGLLLVEAGAGADATRDLAPAGDLVQPPDVRPADQTAPPVPDTGGGTGHDIGKSCSYNEQCQYGICAENAHTGQRFCTAVCDPCAAQPCPEGSGCQNAGPAYICAPAYPNAPCPP